MQTFQLKQDVSPFSFSTKIFIISSDEFRMLSAIGIISHTVGKLSGEIEPTPPTTSKKEKILSPRALLLAMKACHGYLKSKEHLDIEGDQTETEVISKFEN